MWLSEGPWDGVIILVVPSAITWDIRRGSSVQSFSRVQLFPTPWTASRQAFLSITNSWSLLKFMYIESVMPFNCLILCHLLLMPSTFPSIRVFSIESIFRIRWSKYWSFSISPSNEYSGLISFRIDWFGLLALKGLSRVFSSTAVGKHQFFSAQSSRFERPGDVSPAQKTNLLRPGL